jgi:hypothetical protein
MNCPNCQNETPILLLDGKGRQLCRRCKLVALDAEAATQEDAGRLGNALAFVVFAALAVSAVLYGALMRARRWLLNRTDCCWCQPHHRISGNPLVRTANRSHGICPAALAREELKALKEQAERNVQDSARTLAEYFAAKDRDARQKFTIERGTAAIKERAGVLRRRTKISRSELP